MEALYITSFHSVRILIILLLGIASYANSFSVPMQFDDETAVRISTDFSIDLYSFEGFIRKNRWLTDMSFALNRLLHGEQVQGFHLINLAIHLSSAVFIYLLVHRAIEALKLNFRISLAADCYPFLQCFIPFTTAALFVCHPVQTQAVTYISQRYTSLATLLYLSSLLSYLLARISFADKTKKLRIWSWGPACFFLALLAMKSKEIAFTLPLMIVALEVLLFRGRLLKNRLFLALAAGLLLIIPLQLMYIQGSVSAENMLDQMQLATAETQTISRVDYLLTQFRVVATYLRLLILPVNQNLDYDYPVYHSLIDPAVFAALLLHIALIGSAIALFIRSQRCLTTGNLPAGIAMRLACLGIVWFYLALSVESSLIPIRDVIFEHRVYLPSVGFFMAAAAAMAGFAAHRRRYRNALWSATVLLSVGLTASTIARNRIWSDSMVLWQDVLDKSPNKARPRHTVGFLYVKKFMPEKALPYLVRAVEIEPGKDKYRIILNSAISLLSRYNGRCSAGMEYQATVDKVKPAYKNEWSAISYNNLGLAYEHLGNMFLAQENYQKAVTLNPYLDFAWYNLALVAVRRDDSFTVAGILETLRTLNPPLERDVSNLIRKQQH